MAKFHISDDGNARPCSAQISCPYGDLNSQHWDTAEEARAAYEAMTDSSGAPLKKPRRLANLPLTAEDFHFAETLRTDFTGPFAVKFLEDTGVLSSIERVDAYTDDAEKIVRRDSQNRAFLDLDRLAAGHKSFSTSEGVMTRLAASLMGRDTEVNLAEDLARLDLRNRALFLNALADASEIRMSATPF